MQLCYCYWKFWVSLFVLGLSRFDWIWLDLTGFGWIWLDLTGFDWIRTWCRLSWCTSLKGTSIRENGEHFFMNARTERMHAWSKHLGNRSASAQRRRSGGLLFQNLIIASQSLLVRHMRCKKKECIMADIQTLILGELTSIKSGSSQTLDHLYSQARK